MTLRARLGICVFFFLVVGLPATEGRAVGPGDGLYGRFDADFTLAVGLGGGYLTGPDHGGTMVGELRLRHLDAAGPFVAAQWGSGDAPSSVMGGVELRPLFPALFLQNRFLGRERLDLLLQSLGVELGAAYVPLEGGGGLAFVVGLGVEVPIVLPSTWARGLWLRLGARHLRGPASDRLGPDRDRAEWNFYATFAVGFSVGHRVARRQVRRYRP